MFSRLPALCVTLAAICLTASCRPAPPAPAAPKVSENAWAVVDGREITRDDVEKAYRRTRDTAQALSDEETLTAKLSLLNDLILQDILIAKARELKVEVAAAELDKAFADAESEHP